MSTELFTIGHSTHETDYFIGLLRQHNITAVGDVRSQPHSRYNPQYNRETIAAVLKEHDIAYVYLGAELGARSDNPDCYVDGKARYEKFIAEPSFQHGLARLRRGMREHKIALMCAEKDPLICHRTILIAQQLRAECEIKHILADGGIETQAEADARLVKLKLQKIDPSFSRDKNQNSVPGFGLDENERIKRAYALQEEKIAYVRERT